MQTLPPKCGPTVAKVVTLSKQQVFALFRLRVPAIHLRMTPYLVRRTTSALRLP